MVAVTAAEFTAEGTANILVNASFLSGGSHQPCYQITDSNSAHNLRLPSTNLWVGIHKLTTSAYHPNGNGGVERVNHAMAQILATVCNEHQND